MDISAASIKALATILSAAIVCGCSTTRQVDYFAPVPGTSVEVTSAWSTLPEIARLKTAAGAIDVWLVATTPRAQARLVLLLPAGHSIRLRGHVLTATSAATGEVATATIGAVRSDVSESGVRRSVDASPDAVLAGADDGSPREGGARRFEIVATFDAPLADRLSLKLPEMDIDGITVQLPTTIFERKRGAASIGAAP